MAKAPHPQVRGTAAPFLQQLFVAKVGHRPDAFDGNPLYRKRFTTVDARFVGADIIVTSGSTQRAAEDNGPAPQIDTFILCDILRSTSICPPLSPRAAVPVRALRDMEKEADAMPRPLRLSWLPAHIGVAAIVPASLPARAAEGLREPLCRVDIDRPIPPDLAFAPVERRPPVFVPVAEAREIGQFRRYPGQKSFWMRLCALFQRLDAAGTGGERAENSENPMLSAA